MNISFRWSAAFLVAFSAIFFASCQSDSSEKETKNSQVDEFVKTIETGMNGGRPVVLDLHFDKGVFINRVVNDAHWDAQLDAAKNRTYKPEFKAQLMREMSLASMFLSGLDRESYFAYDHAKTYQIENTWHVVFRIYANEAINYHDFLLRVDSAKVWIEDVYITTVGEQLSQIMKENYIAGIPVETQDEKWRDDQFLLRTKQLMQQQQYALALATFDSIRTSVKNKKSMRLFRLQIEGYLPSEGYIRQIDAYEKDYPDDAGTLLLQLDKNFMSGNFPQVLTDLNRLESMYGKDPVIDYLRGNAQNLLGNCEEAGVQYKRAVSVKTDWQSPINNWIDCLLKNGKHDAAIALIKNYQDAFEFTPAYLKYLFRKYPNFFLSTAYKTWAKELDA